MAVKPQAKVALLVIAGATLFGGLRYGATHGLIPSNIGKVFIPTKANLPDVKDAERTDVRPIAYPSTSPASVAAPKIRQESWEWTAQIGEFLANGGADTMKGSLMEKYGVNLHIERQDDTVQMGKDILTCAQEIHDGATQCSGGANIVVIMGDGFPNFAAGLNKKLLKLGPDYGMKVIGSVGYSRGEDKFMAPPSLKANPQSIATTPMQTADGTTIAATGVLVSGVLLDGDWDIALNWAGANNIPNNPDVSTFDKDAINWISSKDYIAAAEDYVAGKCEDRKEVSKGKLTGRPIRVCVNSTVTWTPGDVIVAEKRGGIVPIVSSKEYRSQMPSVIVGPAHFLNQNRTEVQHMLRAIFEAGDQVKTFPDSRHKAAAISAVIYKDEGGNDAKGVPYQHGDYWFKYFIPVVENDMQGLRVSLGGSAVNNLADNKILFGMEPGMNDNMRSTMVIFSNIDKQQYPDMFKDSGDTPMPDIKSLEDKSFLAGLIADMANVDQDAQGAAADTVNYSTGNGDVVSKRSYSINFANGSATPLPDGVAVLAQLKDQIAITGLKVKIDGYTDNTGSAQVNTDLSEGRALAVKNWLQQHARSNFPDTRFSSVQGHGPDRPVATNSTDAGRAQNRRVEITLID